ncbi:MAG: hypothetical protein Kow0092_24750 [Deferrisomatales bacterium]
MVEEPCRPEQARAAWEEARARGATGAVTSWGAGIRGRQTLRTYWELGEGRPAPEGEDLVEENWTPFWRESFRPLRITERTWLVPAWEEPPPDVPCALRIDPGMAFGAGDHPTTRLCLRLLEELSGQGPLPSPALDVGTGTGVLALAAACLGGARVDALDIDPFGYAACRRNALLNGLEDRVRPVLRSLDLLPGRYRLAAANIVSSQLELLAPLLRERLEPGATLLVSGFEADAEARVREALDLAVRGRWEEDGWVALVLAAPPAAAPPR